MPIPFEFDFRNPDYVKVFRHRAEKLGEIRMRPSILPDLYRFYKENPAQFIIDWGMTSDPRNVERGLPVSIPFLLFPKQEEYVHWFMNCWFNQESALVEKSRDMGVTWLNVAIACSIGIFNPGLVFGFGSRKEEYVDKIGDIDSIMEKARYFLANLPVEFRGSWNVKQHSKEKLITIPGSNSILKGESGDNIGRGGRASIYMVDESAHIPRAEMIDASLSATTNFRIDVSTPKGMGNPFAQKRHSGKYKVFTYFWRDDPRKNEKWYERMQLNLDPITLAQEVDLNYLGSVDGVLIPPNWVSAAIDAHEKLALTISGRKRAGLDVADEGKDLNALCMRHGIGIDYIEEWSGKGSDILYTVEHTIKQCLQRGYDSFYYDADGVGAGVKGDARSINEKLQLNPQIISHPFRSSAGVWMPMSSMVRGRRNDDFFANQKAQAWWQLRIRFQNTFRAITEGIFVDEGSVISIPSNLKNLHKVVQQLSQPTYSTNGAGKILVDKKPKGSASPNLADAIMIAFHDANDSIRVSQDAIKLFSDKRL
jgi:hypothetical protein